MTGAVIALRSSLASLDLDTATTDQLAAAIVNNALKRGPEGPIADSRAIAAVFGKRPADVLRRIDAILEELPAMSAHFCAHMGQVPMPRGGFREERYFVLDRTAFNVLVLGFTGAKALRWRVAFVTAFEWLAEKGRHEQWDTVSSWKPSQHPLMQAQRYADAPRIAAQRAQRRAPRNPGDPF